MRSHLESAWRTFQVTPDLSAVLQEISLRGQRDPSARAAFRALHGDWNRVAEDLLRAGVERGELRADLDPHAGARIVTSYIIGAMVQLGINSKAFDFNEVARELERWAAKPAK